MPLKKKFKDGKKKELLQDLEIDLNIGDTVLMGKFKNKKVVVKTIDWNEKGDLLINGRPAFKFRILKKNVDEKLDYKKALKKLKIPMRLTTNKQKLDYDSSEDSDWEEPYKLDDGYPNKEDMKKIIKRVKKARNKTDSNKEYQFDKIEEFLMKVDVSKIIKESSTVLASGKQAVDSGPNMFMGGMKGYSSRNKIQAEKLGWEVISYILNVDVDNVPPHDYDLLSLGWPILYHIYQLELEQEKHQIIKKI
jgi:hypothetical protein